MPRVQQNGAFRNLIVNKLEATSLTVANAASTTAAADTATTITASQNGSTVFLVDPTAAHTITLPPASAISAGWSITFHAKEALGTGSQNTLIVSPGPFLAGNIIVDPTGTLALDTGDGTSHLTFTFLNAVNATIGDAFTFTYDGSLYQVSGTGLSAAGAYSIS